MSRAAGLVGLGIVAVALLMDPAPASAPIGGMAPIRVDAARIARAQAAQPAAQVAAQNLAPAPPEQFAIKRILPIKGAIRYGEWHWDEAGAPAGPIVITVDLDARVLSVFRGGYEIGATAVLLGTQDKPTPLGVFPITQKRKDHVSNIYDAPMPFMQRLTDDGITIHATNVENGYASHGCIGTPIAFAKKLFATTQLGDRVIITRGKTAGVGDPLIAG